MLGEKIVKTDTSHHTITFAVLVPDEVDYSNHTISKDEIVKTAHDFVMNLSEKKVNVDHLDGTDIDTVHIVESYILPEPLEVEGGTLPEGTRMIGLKFDDVDLYTKVISGEYVGVSMEGVRLKPWV